MTTSANRSSNDEGLWVLAVAGLTTVSAVGVWAARTLAVRFDNAPPAVSGNPFAALISTVTGKDPWPPAATKWVIIITAVITVIAVTGTGVWVKHSAGGHSVDRRSKHLTVDTKGITRYLGTPRGPGVSTVPGPPIGNLLRHGRTSKHVVRMAWEDVAVIIAGPRTGKTTSIAIPAIAMAPGALIATSNKVDLYDTTNHFRGTLGTTWLFDPQNLATPHPNPTTGNDHGNDHGNDGPDQVDEQDHVDADQSDQETGGGPGSGVGWWWDPLTMANSVAGARQLAQIWADVGRNPGDRKDPYFDGAGTELLACLLLAAACHPTRPGVIAVTTWLKRPDDRTAEHTLRAAGHHQVAESVESMRQLADRQRDGVYGTARKAVSFLDDSNIAAWVTHPTTTSTGASTVEPGLEDPDGCEHTGDLEDLADRGGAVAGGAGGAGGLRVDTGGRAEFDVDVFVRSTDTLYLLAKEGEGSSAPLVTAFTKAVLDAAERFARTQPGGRLNVPLLAVLDEAANVCRIAELPNLYSHYGSRGIIPMTFLQGWSQGVGVWGEAGMEALWSAANLRVYLGGVAETPFLKRLSELCGDFDAPTRTRTTSNTGTGGGSRSVSYRREPVYTPDTLASWPTGRALIIPSGTRAVVARTQPWTTGPYATALTAGDRAAGTDGNHHGGTGCPEHDNHNDGDGGRVLEPATRPTAP